jgi:Protein of unknown function (DUF1800)
MARVPKAKERPKRLRRKRCRKPLKARSRVVVRKGKRRKEQYCARPRKRRKKALSGPVAAAPVVTVPPPVVTPPPPGVSGPAIPGVPVYDGPFGRREAERLLWRAGFGPTPGQGDALAKLGVDAAVRSLTRPQAPEQFIGPAPKGNNGGALNPEGSHGHDHLWWFDRMIRTNRPLIERMTLVWHDWFATSNATVDSVRMMFIQNEMFRRDGLGSFRQLLLNVASDGAMLKWLNGWVNKAGRPDENYSRESMELFTLGEGRGYTEMDVREMARAHTGWAADRSPVGWVNFHIEPKLQDRGEKTIFGKRGKFDWADASNLCCDHPMHPSFVVEKLWSYFIPTAPPQSTRQAMERAYVAGGMVVLPLVEAILMHPDLYRGESMVKPPVVLAAGLCRALAKGVTGDALFTWTEMAGQRLFHPPNVNGWEDEAWLDTTTMRARWMMVYHLLSDSWIDMESQAGTTYDPAESPGQAVARALALWADPPLSDASRQTLTDWAASCLPATRNAREASQVRALRQNALRQLVGVAPDLQVS